VDTLLVIGAVRVTRGHPQSGRASKREILNFGQDGTLPSQHSTLGANKHIGLFKIDLAHLRTPHGRQLLVAFSTITLEV